MHRAGSWGVAACLFIAADGYGATCLVKWCGDSTALEEFRGRVEEALARLATPEIEPHQAAAALTPLSDEDKRALIAFLKTF